MSDRWSAAFEPVGGIPLEMIHEGRCFSCDVEEELSNVTLLDAVTVWRYTRPEVTMGVAVPVYDITGRPRDTPENAIKSVELCQKHAGHDAPVSIFVYQRAVCLRIFRHAHVFVHLPHPAVDDPQQSSPEFTGELCHKTCRDMADARAKNEMTPAMLHWL